MSPWQAAFLAVSAVLREPLDEASRALDEQARARATVLLGDLRSTSRETRARAIAQHLTDVVAAIDEMRLV